MIETNNSQVTPMLNWVITRTPSKNHETVDQTYKSKTMSSYTDRMDKISMKIDLMQRDYDNLVEEIQKLKADSKIFKQLTYKLSVRLSVKDRQLVSCLTEDEKSHKMKEIESLEIELAKLKEDAATFSDILVTLKEERCIKLKRLEKCKRKHVELASNIGITSPYTLKEKHTRDSNNDLSIAPKVLFQFGMNPLHNACHRNETDQILSLLNNMNRDELVMQKDSDERTPLHYAVNNNNVSSGTISSIIEIGGKELVLEKDCYGENALHIACQKRASFDIISKLIDIGDKDAIFAKDNKGATPLHVCTSTYNPSMEVILKLLDLGGESLVMEKDFKGKTVLHKCVSNGTSFDAISKLIEKGGKNLVTEKDNDGMTALHQIKCTKTVSVAVLSKLLELGGRQLISDKDITGKIPLHHHICHGVFASISCKEIISLLIDVGIEEQVGGEYGVGGLFNVASGDVQFEIYESWNDTILPIIIKNKKLIETQPILQAAIFGRAPSFILKDIIDNFDCLTSKDSQDRSPIEVAVREGLKWNDGMKEIIEAVAVKESRPIINVALHYGLKWNTHMKELLYSSLNEYETERDRLTGLELYMLAAMHEFDLNAIFFAMIHNPQKVRKCASKNACVGSS